MIKRIKICDHCGKKIEGIYTRVELSHFDRKNNYIKGGHASTDVCNECRKELLGYLGIEAEEEKDG